MLRTNSVTALLVVLMLAGCQSTRLAQEDGEIKHRIPPEILTEGFLGAHPDLRWRREAFMEYDKGNYKLVLPYLKRAARYADKPA